MTAHRRNAAGRDQLIHHLMGCAFAPPLNSYLDPDAYVDKPLARAERFECWDGEELVGLVAVYCNDLASRRGFVTNVSTSPGHSGRGIAGALLDEAIDHCRALGFTTLALEVRAGNPAIGLYERRGFAENRRSGGVVEMSRPLTA